MPPETLTLSEIEARFSGEWVLLLDPEPWDEEGPLPIARGKLIFHSPHRNEITPHAVALPSPKNIAVFFVGKPPLDLPILLNFPFHW